jgi:hypothetical protein
MRSSRDGSSCRIRGTDYLTAVTIGGTAAAAGDVLVSQVVNPARLSIARLATMARLYERYKFKSLKFRYAPVANSTVSGQIIGYVDYDTYDNPSGTSGVQNLQRAAAHYGEKPVQVWQGGEKPVFWEIKDIDPMTDLYIDTDESDPRWTNQGRFVLLAASAIAANTACGNIYLDYDVEFYIPQIEVTPSSGFADKFTGSSSCTTSAILGTSISASTWNNLPLVTAPSGNTYTVSPGSYLAVLYVTGTSITAVNAVASGTTSTFGTVNLLASAGAEGCSFIQFTVTANATITMSASAAAIANATLMLTLLPSSATTLSARRVCAIERMVKSLEDDPLLQGLLKSRLSDGKESKPLDPVPVVRQVASGSTSSASSGVNASTYSPSLLRSVDDNYVLVKRA